MTGKQFWAILQPEKLITGKKLHCNRGDQNFKNKKISEIDEKRCRLHERLD